VVSEAEVCIARGVASVRREGEELGVVSEEGEDGARVLGARSGIATACVLRDAARWNADA
jgi:hypothetical protein